MVPVSYFLLFKLRVIRTKESHHDGQLWPDRNITLSVHFQRLQYLQFTTSFNCFSVVLTELFALHMYFPASSALILFRVS